MSDGGAGPRRLGDGAGGYAWLYVDALDEAGDGLVCILFRGSVFSPRYAARLRRGEPARGAEHVALNLALYRGGRQVAWVMSEHGANGRFDEAGARVGDTVLAREPGGALRIDVRDRAARFLVGGGVVLGVIRVEPLAPPLAPIDLASASARAAHRWRVIAPRARVTARFTRPDFTLDAPGYHDENEGDGPLHETFASWGWARFHGARATTMRYVTNERAPSSPGEGVRRSIALDVRDGEPATLAIATPEASDALRRGAWGLRVPARFGEAPACELLAPLEATPFYARHRARLVGEGADERAIGVAEWLDLDRFGSRFIQFLLRFKMRHVESMRIR